MEDKIITIFTPTYNRAYKLPDLYVSLCKQTSQQFEWLIVDDGSTDETERLVDAWIKEKKIFIRYLKQENGGKQRAHNTGVLNSDLELFFCVDSDDIMADDCVEKHLERWNQVRNNERVAGIISLKGDLKGNPLGTYFPEGLDCVSRKLLYGKMKFKGDASLIYRTSLFKQHLYWVAEGEKFIGEGYVFSQIDEDHEMAVLPEVLTFCEYLPDGYTQNVRKITKENPKSYVVLKRQTIEYAETWKDRFIQTILYMVGCRMSKEKNAIKRAPYPILAALAYFPAWLAWYLFYKNA